jgi:hypothetical protein
VAALIFIALFAAAVFAVLALAAWVADRPPTPPRTDQRIPADELALTGLDWRDPVRPYFQRRWESKVRTRAAVNHVCGIELQLTTNNEGRVADPTGPQATQRR